MELVSMDLVRIRLVEVEVTTTFAKMGSDRNYEGLHIYIVR
jgi:hypothetical protein